MNWPRVILQTLLSLLSVRAWAAAPQTTHDSDRPKLPYSMLGLRCEDIEAYDSKGEPVAPQCCFVAGRL